MLMRLRIFIRLLLQIFSEKLVCSVTRKLDLFSLNICQQNKLINNLGVYNIVKYNYCFNIDLIDDEIQIYFIIINLTIMDKLPSKSLSKSILIATPLFCIILALLDASDDLSYLFVLEFLGNVAGSADIIFIPTMQPQIHSTNYDKNLALERSGVFVDQFQIQNQSIPLIDIRLIEQWGNKHQIVRGISPRWLVPIELPKTDSLLLVVDVNKELKMGIGLKSNLQQLKDNQIALSSELLNKLSLSVGDELKVKISFSNMLRGTKLIQKYQSFESRDQYLVDTEEASIQKIEEAIYNAISQRGKQYNITISKQQVHNIVNQIYNLQLSYSYTVKYQYKNNGLYSSSLHNVVLMQFNGFANLLEELITQKVIKSKTLQKIVYDSLDQSGLSQAQIVSLKAYYKLARSTNIYSGQIQNFIQQTITNYPLMAIASFKNRELVYSPDQKQLTKMTYSMQSTPGDFQVISIYPLFKDLEGIRFFFKSVIQIFAFICATIYFYIIQLILKQVFEEKQIQVGIWRTLGAGGVKSHPQSAPSSQKDSLILKQELTWRQKVNYAYQMIVKVGFFYYWLISAFVSALLFALVKQIIYHIISNVLKYDSPPQQWIYPLVLFLAIFIFTITLTISHIRQIYVNPLVSTIKPVKRTFDLVKVRIIKMATFGITVQMLIIALMLIYYGVVSYYWIPVSILYNNGWLQTILFNSIFLFMIFGGIILLTVMQSRMQCGILNILFILNKHLSTMKLIILKTIKAKQYKNIKVSIIIAIIFAFLLFFSSGIRIQIVIVQSFIERQLGANLVMENYEKQTFNRTVVQNYLNTLPEVKYSWLSNNLNNKVIKIQLESIVSAKNPVKNDFKILTSNYLDTTYFEYYYPEQYIQQDKHNYQKLSNGIYNGFNSIYKYDGVYNNQSVGKYNSQDTLTVYDPFCINLNTSNHLFPLEDNTLKMADHEQIINLVVTTQLRKKLGVSAGDSYKLSVQNTLTGSIYYLRCRIVHSFKIGPGLDIFKSIAFISQQQAKYIYQILEQDPNQIKFQKLFVTAPNDLNNIGNKIINLSPEHTQIFEMNIVRQSFQLLQTYLKGFIFLITIILGSLSVLFLFIYTYGKCKQQAEVFKMLRAIGLPVFDIRLMIFLQIFIRIIISIANGIILGIVFSLGLSAQIQQILMINTPALDLKMIFVIALMMLALFSVTVIRSTNYLTERTVLQTSKA